MQNQFDDEDSITQLLNKILGAAGFKDIGPAYSEKEVKAMREVISTIISTSYIQGSNDCHRIMKEHGK